MLKALSIRQPHGNAILYYGKDFENRPKCMNIRGTIAIHVGAKLDNSIYLPENFKKQIVRSAIIGVVDILDCVKYHKKLKTRWFSGPYGYVLDNPRPLLKPIPCKGQLGFWTLPPAVEKEVKRQLRGKFQS